MTKYEEELNGLSGHVGERNTHLVHLARLGLREGRDAATLQAEIVAAGGTPRLRDDEVSRAIQAAQRTAPHRPSAPFKPCGTPFKPRERPVNAKERGFVRDMIAAGKGATSRDLMRLSRATFPELWPSSADRGLLAAAYLRRLFREGDLIFAGTPRLPRTRESIRTREELIAELTRPGAAFPTHFIPNPFTGEAGLSSEGKVSFCLDSTVAHRRMALVEFDDLPLTEQAAFWMGTIREGALRVQSLVYSGGKSIHGLVELEEGEGAWERQWAVLERTLCSDDDSSRRADRACRNPSRLTRFPEAIRPESSRRQRLIWMGPGMNGENMV